jgi:hypothetical protein
VIGKNKNLPLINTDDTDQEESGDRKKAKSLKHRRKEEAEGDREKAKTYHG